VADRLNALIHPPASAGVRLIPVKDAFLQARDRYALSETVWSQVEVGRAAGPRARSPRCGRAEYRRVSSPEVLR